ncbi:Hypothetical predicted protein [Podarcis lilfordi]|uniref:Uncharacterized protein n=1 Tax=Podarcis lilfordi TaxID=74358 RepID=A0AA35JSY2_9SAUR|nr:Hypothetical predicted protein [Podarcis lilfordi]
MSWDFSQRGPKDMNLLLLHSIGSAPSLAAQNLPVSLLLPIARAAQGGPQWCTSGSQMAAVSRRNGRMWMLSSPAGPED